MFFRELKFIIVLRLFCRRSDQNNNDNLDNEIDVEARKEYIDSRIIIKVRFFERTLDMADVMLQAHNF